MKIDKEFQNLIPLLSEEEYSGLEQNIKKNGCLDPLKMWGEILVDGHNRYKICTEFDISYKITQIEFTDRNAALIWIIRNQLDRRNLPLYERGRLELLQASTLEEQAKERQRQAGGDRKSVKAKPLVVSLPQAVKPERVVEQISKKSGISASTLQHIKKIEKKAPEAVKEKLRTGETTINQAYKNIQKEEKKEQRAEKIKLIQEQKEKNPHLFQDKLPSLILADPPWRYQFSETHQRDIENQYETATIEDIFSHSPKTKKDCLLFLWATAPKLLEAIRVMEWWGFEYKTCAVWDKEIIGMGYWFRGQHELLLVGTKGKMSPPDADLRVSSVFRERRSKHSKKPVCVYEWIEKTFPEYEKLEMYCREARPDWLTWGNEI